MNVFIKLLIILNFCSCTYFNFSEINDAKKEVKLKCVEVVDLKLVHFCENGVQYFAYEGLTSPEVSGDQEKISNYIESLRKKAEMKCQSFYGDDDRSLIACDAGVELAEKKAREMFLEANNNTSNEVETSELAINQNDSNNKRLVRVGPDHVVGSSAVGI